MAGALPGAFWFWFAGHYCRVRHEFRALRRGLFLSHVKAVAVGADEEEAHVRNCAFSFDRAGNVAWAPGNCGPLLATDPHGLFHALLLGALPNDPNGAVPEPVRKLGETGEG